MKVMLLNGSARLNSHTKSLVEEIAKELQQQGVEQQVVNLFEYDLPRFSVDIDAAKQQDEKTKEFIDLTKSCDAYVWATPIYHGTLSSVLKNALEWQHFFLDGKVVGLASNGHGRSPVAVEHMMHVARAQHTVVVPTRVCSQPDDFDEQLNLTNDEIKQRIVQFVNQLIDITQRFAE